MPSPSSSSSTSTVPLADSNVDALLALVKWGGPVGTSASLSFSFPWLANAPAWFAGYSGEVYSQVGENTATSHYGLSAVEQSAAREALQKWAAVANLSFPEVADTSTSVGDIRFAWTSAVKANSTGSQAWGWASYPDSFWPIGGDIWISTLASGATQPADWSSGSSNYGALLHEIGHALGLKHTFEGSVQLGSAMDNTQYSLMSYTQGPHSLFVQVTRDGSSVSWRSFNVQPDTPMLLDIAAMQYLYGANLSYRTGNDTYTFDPATPFMRTIWDAGGTDTISVANFSKGCVIDLGAGHFSSITITSDSTAGFNWKVAPPTPTYDGTENLAIAYGVVIENAVGGAGNDVLTGNDVNNLLQGGGGNDSLNGGAGLDIAAFAGPSNNYAVARTVSGWSVSDRTGGEGSDALVAIERIRFADKSLAMDLTGNAGIVAKTLGAVFGPASISNQLYAGIGLNLVDGGMSFERLMQLALDTALGANAGSYKAIVDLLYQNVVGVAPSADAEALYVDMLQKGTSTVASLGVLAAETSFNQDHINLVGLTQTGLAYTPA